MSRHNVHNHGTVTHDPVTWDPEGDARVAQAAHIKAEYERERRDLVSHGGELPPLDPTIAYLDPEACRKNPEMLTALLAHAAQNDVAVEGEKNETGFLAHLWEKIKGSFGEKSEPPSILKASSLADMTEAEKQKLLHSFDVAPKIDLGENPVSFGQANYGAPINIAENIETSFADLKVLGIQAAGNVDFNTVGVIDNFQLPPPLTSFGPAEFNALTASISDPKKPRT